MKRTIVLVTVFLVIAMSTSTLATSSYEGYDNVSASLLTKGEIIDGNTSFFVGTIDSADTHGGENDLPAPHNLQEDKLFFDIAFVFSIINATLCCVLIFLYLSIWKKTKSEFSIGLILLSAALLLHSISANPFFHELMGFSPYGLGPFVPIPVFFTTLALSVLLYLSTR